MIQLIYQSIANPVVIDHRNQRIKLEVLHDLVKSAASANVRADVTGALVTDNERFIQVLEGNEQTVGALMEKIRANDRHRGVKVVKATPIRKRMFAQWSMVMAEIPASVAPEHRDLFLGEGPNSRLSVTPDTAQRVSRFIRWLLGT